MNLEQKIRIRNACSSSSSSGGSSGGGIVDSVTGAAKSAIISGAISAVGK
jgi:hypothetical protein